MSKLVLRHCQESPEKGVCVWGGENQWMRETEDEEVRETTSPNPWAAPVAQCQALAPKSCT